MMICLLLKNFVVGNFEKIERIDSMIVNEYYIDKGLTIPDMIEYKFPFDQMEVGDSFLVLIQDWLNMGMIDGLKTSIKDLSPKKYKYTIRVEYNGFRVWRTE